MYKTKWLEKIVFIFSSWFGVQGFSKLWSFACWLSLCCPQNESLWIPVLSTKINCIYFSSIHLEPQMYELVQRRENFTVNQEPKSLSFMHLISTSLTKWSKKMKKKGGPIYLRFTQWNSNLFKILGWSIVSHITVFRKFYESSRFLEIILGLSGKSLCILKHTFPSFKFKFKVIHNFVIDQATEPHKYNLVNLYFTIKLKKNHQKKCIFSFLALQITLTFL